MLCRLGPGSENWRSYEPAWMLRTTQLKLYKAVSFLYTIKQSMNLWPSTKVDSNTLPTRRTAYLKGQGRTSSKHLAVIFSFILTITLILFGRPHTWSRRARSTTQRDTDWKSLPPGTVKWWPCDLEGDLEGSECGFIITPLDYFNADAGVAKVALGRYKAKKFPRKGSILINPGGPGASGKTWVTQLGASFQAFLSENYDIVGFDPRGIGLTEPGVHCLRPQDNVLFGINSILQTGFDVAPNISDPETRNHLIIQQREVNALYKTIMEVCKASLGNTIRYMGSSTIARDVDFITTVLEGDSALINYWGISYGSVLGSYIVNMFPDRVGRVVIDGIAHAGKWASIPGYKFYRQWLTDTDAVYDLFFAECSKSRCALAKHDSEEPEQIKSRVENLFNKLYFNPMPVPNANLPGLLTQGMVAEALFESLQFPLTWPDIANYLHETMNGNGTILTSKKRYFGNSLPSNAVACNDNLAFAPPTAEEMVDEGLYLLENISRFAYTAPSAEPETVGCQYWPVNPPERFQGPWNHTLRNPILVISNELDPVTPLESGRWIRGQLGDSARLMIREGPGHTSISLPSICSGKVTRNYFLDGVLPPDEYLCPVDAPIFPPKEAPNQTLSEGDEYLLMKLYEISEYINRWMRWPLDPSWRF